MPRLQPFLRAPCRAAQLLTAPCSRVRARCFRLGAWRPQGSSRWCFSHDFTAARAAGRPLGLSERKTSFSRGTLTRMARLGCGHGRAQFVGPNGCRVSCEGSAGATHICGSPGALACLNFRSWCSCWHRASHAASAAPGRQGHPWRHICSELHAVSLGRMAAQAGWEAGVRSSHHKTCCAVSRLGV